MSIAFAIVAASVAGSASEPSRTWIVSQQPKSCLALRARSDDRLGLAIRTRPFWLYSEVLILAPKAGNVAAYVPITISVPPARHGVPPRARVIETAQSTDRVLIVSITGEQLDAAIGAGSLTVDARRHGRHTVDLSGAGKLPAALNECADRVADELGLKRLWVEPPVESNDFQGLLRSSDYPSRLIDQDRQGGLTALLEIDSRGAVAGCKAFEIEGDPGFEQAVCKVAKNRARFTPARDAKGQPVASYYLTPQIWFVLE